MLRPSLVTAPLVPVHMSPEDERDAQILDNVLAIALCGVLAFAIAVFGATDYWAMCVLQIASGALLVLWSARQLASGRIKVIWNPLFIPLLLLAAVITIQLLWRTEYWYATWVKSIQWLCYAMVFFVASQTLRGENRLRQFGLFLVFFGTLVALVAIAQGGTGSDKVFWLFPTDSPAVLYGPYANHAHYAGLMEMLLPVPLVFGLSGLFKSHEKVLLLFAALIMAGSIFLAASFGGVLSFAGELIVFTILLLRRRRRHRVWISILVLLLVLSLFIVILQPAVFQQRLEGVRSKTEEAELTGRLAIVRDSLPMILKRPVLGYGLGTFVEVFPSYRTFLSNYTINAAHNDYVQAMVEIGLVGFALIAVLVFLLFREGMRKARNWEHDNESSMAMAALVGCSGILIHSLCDFNLQVSANAALFAVLAAIAVSPRLGHSENHRRRFHARTHRWQPQ